MAAACASTLVQPALACLHLGVVRPQDAQAVYRFPRPELARLTDREVLHRAATGYYVAIPHAEVGAHWLPEFEPLAAGSTASVYGADKAILMGVSAARVLGVAPQATGERRRRRTSASIAQSHTPTGAPRSFRLSRSGDSRRETPPSVFGLDACHVPRADRPGSR